MKEFLPAVQGYIFFLQWSETDSHCGSGTYSMKPLICHAPGGRGRCRGVIMDVTGLRRDWSRLTLQFWWSCGWKFSWLGEWAAPHSPHHPVPWLTPESFPLSLPWSWNKSLQDSYPGKMPLTCSKLDRKSKQYSFSFAISLNQRPLIVYASLSLSQPVSLRTLSRVEAGWSVPVAGLLHPKGERLGSSLVWMPT